MSAHRPASKRPHASTLGPARAANFRVATWNCGMPNEDSFKTQPLRAREQLCHRLLALLKQVHVLGVNELHRVWFDEARPTSLHDKFGYAGFHFGTGDAVIWPRISSRAVGMARQVVALRTASAHGIGEHATGA
ncbi:MAG: hypothetical protein GY772_06370 [bacterium]|nr:hypothetical protein [bacterium]